MNRERKKKKRYISELFFFFKSGKLQFIFLFWILYFKIMLCRRWLLAADWKKNKKSIYIYTYRNLKYKSITETGNVSQSHDFTNVKKWKEKKTNWFLKFQ